MADDKTPEVVAEPVKDGRPPAIPEQDLPKLKTFMRLKPTLADTAAFFQCSERTIERTIRERFDLTFVEFREQNMVHTRMNVIRKAISMAESGNVPMLIFTLKNLCGWADKIDTRNEHVHEDKTKTDEELIAEGKRLAAKYKD